MGADDARIAGRLTIAYLMSLASAVLRSVPIDLLDLLLVTSVANFNTMAPDNGRAGNGPPYGISRNAISRSLNIPLETVRRRVARLIERDLLDEQSDGLVFKANESIGLGNNSTLNVLNLELLRELFGQMKEAGIKLD
ncbi:MAG: hypothetical protein JSR60_14325 [Proteobacteria bacterium]|nr:hypothetical protein [Pseudomonadota bacterium]